MGEIETQNYLEFLDCVHKSTHPEYYLEIGAQNGQALALAREFCVAIAPEFNFEGDVVQNKPGLCLFQCSPRAYFGMEFMRRSGFKFDLAFLHNLAPYHEALFSFMKLEKFMSRQGRIIIKGDFINNIGENARHAHETPPSDDLWKILPILAKHRPDLKLTIYDAKPTGLLFVENLDPKTRLLDENYHEICTKFDQIDRPAKYTRSFEPVSCAQSPFKPTPRKIDPLAMNFVIHTAIPKPAVKDRWGDWPIAEGLAAALIRAGHHAEIRTVAERGHRKKSNEIDLVLRGRRKFEKDPLHHCLYWVISHSPEIEAEELLDVDWIFAGSPLVQKRFAFMLASHYEKNKTSLLPQAFDQERMYPPENGEERQGTVFVGRSRNKYARVIVDYAHDSGIKFDLYGPGWDKDKNTKTHLKANFVPNEDLGQIYRKSEIVLNDHAPKLAEDGLASNRIFDALACGAAVVSDKVAWIPSEFEPFIYQVKNLDKFREAIYAARNETEEEKRQRQEFAREIVELHSFDARARIIIEKMRSLITKRS